MLPLLFLSARHTGFCVPPCLLLCDCFATLGVPRGFVSRGTTAFVTATFTGLCPPNFHTSSSAASGSWPSSTSKDDAREAEGDVESQVAHSPVPLGDILGSIFQVVQAEESMVVAWLAPQQQWTMQLDTLPLQLSQPSPRGSDRVMALLLGRWASLACCQPGRWSPSDRGFEARSAM